MTFIHVMSPQGRIGAGQRRVLAKTLTDAVLVPEVGRLVPEARRGYQVHFLERPLDKRNFRKKVLSSGGVKETDELHLQGRHRPARLYEFDLEARDF